MAAVYKLCFYVPEEHAEAVKQAVFEAGAGHIGAYDRCCFQVPGQGQFRPLTGSNPYIGTAGEIERVREFRVEMVCHADRLRAAVSALRAAHPYEEPAIDLWRLEPLPD